MRSTETKSQEVSWSVPVVVADIEESGLRVTIEANEAERGEIARVAGLRELSKLSAEFELTPIAGEQVRVVGQVERRSRADLRRHARAPGEHDRGADQPALFAPAERDSRAC